MTLTPKAKTTPRPAITMAAIRRDARQVAELFEPEKTMLFGSFTEAWFKVIDDVCRGNAIPQRQSD